MRENSAIFETSFGSDSTKIPLGLCVLFVVPLECLAHLKTKQTTNKNLLLNVLN